MRIGFLTIEWTDALDVLLVSVLLYQFYQLVKGSLASKVFLGYLFVYVFYLIVKGMGLELLTSILEYFMGVGSIALIVIFQQEIRRFLLLIGRSTELTNNRIYNKFFGATVQTAKSSALKLIVQSCKSIASEFNGALIVVRKNDDLTRFIESGVKLDAIISQPLLVSIFNQYSLLGEGAVIIEKSRIVAAKCVLPVSESDERLPMEVGFRHRAAIEMSDATDAAVLVVSSQTGKISVAIEGHLWQNMTLEDLEKKLVDYLSV